MAGTSNPNALGGATPAASSIQPCPVGDKKIIALRWNQSDGWCSEKATIEGKTEGYANGDHVSVSCKNAADQASVAQFKAMVLADDLSHDWQVLEVMPPKTGEHYAEKMDVNGHAEDQKTPVPLKINFTPNLPKTAYQQNNVHFELSATDYEVKIEGALKFMKGWAGEVVDLGGTVPTGTGGLLDGKLSWNGYRWMKIINKTRKYWNGSAWTDLPEEFELADSNNFAVGFYKNGTKFTCQYGGDWPEPFPDWNIDAQANKDKIKKWQDNINTTWTGKFKLKREQCKSTNNNCCSYTTKTDVKFSKQTSFTSGMLIIADGNIRSNDSLFFLGETRIAVAAHEFGHHLGNPDEYANATSVDTSLNDDGAVNGIDKDSLMGQDLTKVKKRHYRTICKHLADMVKTRTGKTYTYKAD